ncbi:apolipoprotein A1/A4/E family protein [Nostoc flagelliforme FACHB-838]|uniref:Apolipoprotein A1/A4/E family protein n=1 Tax=Nostoc flagelliforme FACHB-838 TaxID=2692904 RepID=A0ABR8DRZ3_9NOSO|nr:apolipoprotein A1/A4/E family protein [Nostoc flagelliforme]MBD2531903.1 apolipoprotein A1/A4/E family protein [Nostoc flagelliforme FACHB-838]
MLEESRSEGKQVQQDYLDILDAILKKIQEKGQFQGLGQSKDVTIFVGREAKYKGTIGQKPFTNSMTPELVDTLNKAISDPEKLKGSVRITIGNEKVFHAKDGKVITDKLGLSITQSQTQNNKLIQTQAQTNKAEVPQQSPLQSITIESLQKQIDSLQKQVQEQQILIDSLKVQKQSSEITQKLSTEIESFKKAVERQQKTIEQLQKGLESILNRSTPTIKNSALQNWVGSVESKVKQTAKNLVDQAKTALTPKVDKLKSQIENQIEELKTQVSQQITSLKAEVQSQINDLKNQVKTDFQNAINNVNSIKETTHTAAQEFQNKVVGQVQSIHKEVTKMAQDTQSLAVNTVKEGIQAVNTSIRETKGKAIEASVGAMLQLFGDRQADGSISFESQNFHFHQQGNAISIQSKDGRDVMKDGALTSLALEQDVEALEKVRPMVEEYLEHSESQTQSSKLRQ